MVTSSLTWLRPASQRQAAPVSLGPALNDLGTDYEPSQEDAGGGRTHVGADGCAQRCTHHRLSARLLPSLILGYSLNSDEVRSTIFPKSIFSYPTKSVFHKPGYAACAISSGELSAPSSNTRGHLTLSPDHPTRGAFGQMPSYLDVG
jgi:hypothetical protein